MSRRATMSLSYRFKGRAIEGSGVTLAQALGDLSDLWNSRPSLVMHSWGVMRIDVTVSGVTVAFDVTDPKVLDASEDGRSQVLVAWMAEKAGITPEEMQLLLANATDVTASVDRIRPPNQPDFWKPDADHDPDMALASAGTEWSTALSLDLKKAGKQTKKGVRESNKLAELIVKTATRQGKTLSQISTDTGIPRSTLGDASARLERKTKASLSKRRPGQKLSSDERQMVLDRWASTGKATDVERETGIPARTIRDIVKKSERSVQRTERVTAESVTRSGKRAGTREEIIRLVETGMSASAAGRKVGIPERTAREWVQKAKDFPEE